MYLSFPYSSRMKSSNASLHEKGNISNWIGHSHWFHPLSVTLNRFLNEKFHFFLTRSLLLGCAASLRFLSSAEQEVGKQRQSIGETKDKSSRGMVVRPLHHDEEDGSR